LNGFCAEVKQTTGTLPPNSCCSKAFLALELASSVVNSRNAILAKPGVNIIVLLKEKLERRWQAKLLMNLPS
jgi:hypothetical protein